MQGLHQEKTSPAGEVEQSWRFHEFSAPYAAGFEALRLCHRKVGMISSPPSVSTYCFPRNVMDVFDIAFSGVMLPITVLTLLVLAYWLLVIFGIVGLE